MLKTCPVHGCDLKTGPGFRWRCDILPSTDFMEAHSENPFALDVEFSFTARPGIGMDACQLTWCPQCQANMKRRLGG
jgi:hypothetical protein